MEAELDKQDKIVEDVSNSTINFSVFLIFYDINFLIFPVGAFKTNEKSCHREEEDGTPVQPRA